MLAHSQGMFRRVADFRIDTTAPAVDLSRVPQKTTKNYVVTYHVVCFLLHKPEKLPRLKNSYLLVRAAVKLLLKI